MKGRVSQLNKERRKITDLDGDIDSIQKKKNDLFEAIYNDIQSSATPALVRNLSERLDNGRGVYSDENLTGSTNRIDDEIRYLERAIRLKEEAERAMREAQAQLSRN